MAICLRLLSILCSVKRKKYLLGQETLKPEHRQNSDTSISPVGRTFRNFLTLVLKLRQWLLIYPFTEEVTVIMMIVMINGLTAARRCAVTFTDKQAESNVFITYINGAISFHRLCIYYQFKSLNHSLFAWGMGDISSRSHLCLCVKVTLTSSLVRLSCLWQMISYQSGHTHSQVNDRWNSWLSNSKTLFTVSHWTLSAFSAARKFTFTQSSAS